MKYDSSNAQPMGTLIEDGSHRPIHALACPLRSQLVRIGRRKSVDS